MSLTKGWCKNTVTWDDMIETYNTAIEEGGEIKANLPGFFVCHNAHKIEKVREAMEMLGVTDAHAYFNISHRGKTFGEHYDDIDVFYWQCIGKVKVIVDGSKEFILEPGDMIKLPKYIHHHVIPLTPRVGISMSGSKVNKD